MYRVSSWMVGSTGILDAGEGIDRVDVCPPKSVGDFVVLF